jgi:DNA-binding PadR family transcriptional regulator
MSKKNLIVLDTRARGTIENASYFRITECGSYYLNRLIQTFVYLDGVWMDSPIADGDVVDKLRSVMDTTLLEVKMKRTRIFLDYLLQMEENGKARHPEFQASPLGRFSFVKSMKSGFERDRDKAYWSLRKKDISRF